MQEASYPDFDQHRKLHTYFKEGILAHIQALQAGDQKDVTLVMGSLKNWLIKHIQEEDTKLKKVLS
jgi:hemerythrin-like metal-binding protein